MSPDPNPAAVTANAATAAATATATDTGTATATVTVTASPGGPLNPAELAELEAPSLPSRERHQLRLLAHGLRTLQQIAGRRQGPPPPLAAIEAWARQQPGIGDDDSFVGAFAGQLQLVGQQLSDLAGDRPGGALAVELSELIHSAQLQSQAPQA